MKLLGFNLVLTLIVGVSGSLSYGGDSAHGGDVMKFRILLAKQHAKVFAESPSCRKHFTPDECKAMDSKISNSEITWWDRDQVGNLIDDKGNTVTFRTTSEVGVPIYADYKRAGDLKMSASEADVGMYHESYWGTGALDSNASDEKITEWIGGSQTNANLVCVYEKQNQDGQVDSTTTAPEGELFSLVMRRDLLNFGNNHMCSQGCFEGSIGWNYRLDLGTSNVVIDIYNTQKFQELFGRGGLSSELPSTYWAARSINTDDLATTGLEIRLATPEGLDHNEARLGKNVRWIDVRCKSDRPLNIK